MLNSFTVEDVSPVWFRCRTPLSAAAPSAPSTGTASTVATSETASSANNNGKTLSFLQCPIDNRLFQCRCVEKPDPCDPSPCGPGTRCEVNHLGNSICHCLAGLIPKPDTITGCGPECETDYDCQQGYQCRNQKCVEKPDPCNPNPCGMMAICTPRYVWAKGIVPNERDILESKCPSL